MPCENMDEWATFQHAYKLPDAKKKIYPSQIDRKRAKNVWLFNPDGELRQIQSRQTPPAVQTPSSSPEYPALSSVPHK